MQNGRIELKTPERIQLFDRVSCNDSIDTYLNVQDPWSLMVDKEEPDIDSNHKVINYRCKKHIPTNS